MIGRLATNNFNDQSRRITTSDTAPSSPVTGDIWYKTDVGTTLIYYDSTWIEISGGGGGGGSSSYTITNSSTDSAILLMEVGP
jgi:hypothetical protein